MEFAPDGQTGVAGAFNFFQPELMSFTVPDMTPVSTVDWQQAGGGILGGAISLVFAPSGNRLFVRSWDASKVGAFDYDSTTGVIGSEQFSIDVDRAPSFFGVDQMAISPDGSTLYVPEDTVVNRYNTIDGTFLGILADSLSDAAGIDIVASANTDPIADPNGPYLGAADTPMAFDGTGSSDPDGDPLSYNWDFGDGNSGVGATLNHSFDEAGIYDVCLTVDDGAVTDTACTIAVVYDPSAGFVTGGGWIYSPRGAYEPDASLEGKAIFGFVAKYQKGATEPTGQTEFQFQTADVNFHSTSYEWLVVTGGDTAKFKGTGTINGVGEYKFMVWAGDSDDDTFRIKIWQEDNLGIETMIYDNGFDQVIDGGSIHIHASKKGNALLVPSSTMLLTPFLSRVADSDQDLLSPPHIETPANEFVMSTQQEQATADLVFAEKSGTGLGEDTLFKELDHFFRSEGEHTVLLNDEHDENHQD